MSASSFVRWARVAVSSAVIALAATVFASGFRLAPLYLSIPALMAFLVLLPKSAAGQPGQV